MEQHSASPRRRSGVGLRQLIPMLLALVGMFLLIGCIYLPIPEHKVGPEKDFRDLLGDQLSQRPIRRGDINRSAVIRILGAPPYLSQDGRAIGYVVRTQTGFAIWPLCFHAGQDEDGAYVVRLVFDERDILTDWEITHVSEGSMFGGGAPEISAVWELNRHGPKLLTPMELKAATQPTK